jgi:multiple sugar transport system substrate-binding protein
VLKSIILAFTMSLRLHLNILFPFVLLIPSCSPRDNGTTELVFWAFGAEGEHVAKLIPGFEQRYPEIRVRVQMIPWNAAHEKLLTAFAGQSLPDMCQLGNTWIPEFTVLNALEPLAPWLAGSSTIYDSSYFPGIWETNFIDSILYGIPWYVDTRVLFYRRDLFERVGYSNPPRSWDEWFDLSARLKARFPGDYAMLLPTNNEWSQPVIMGMQEGSPLLKDKDTRGDFSGPEFVAAMHAFHRFFENGWAPTRPTQIVNVYQSFAEGYFAMYITGPWNIGEFMRRLPDTLQDAWMTAPLPGPKGGIGVSLAGGSSLVMFKSSKHKPEVWKLIEYLSEPAQQLQLYHFTGDLPGRVEAWKDSALANNKYAAAFFEQLKHVVPTPKVPEWEQIAQKTREYVELISLDVLSVEKGMAELDRQVDVILEKRRWLIYGQ